jgi:hypothetical protein
MGCSRQLRRRPVAAKWRQGYFHADEDPPHPEAGTEGSGLETGPGGGAVMRLAP